MSIETDYENDPRSSGAQCFRRCMHDRFAPLERGDQLEVEVGISINISSLRDEELAKTILLRKQEVVGLLHRGALSPRLTSSLLSANRVQLLVVAAEIDGAVTSDSGSGIGALAHDELPLLRAVGVDRVELRVVAAEVDRAVTSDCGRSTRLCRPSRTPTSSCHRT